MVAAEQLIESVLAENDQPLRPTTGSENGGDPLNPEVVAMMDEIIGIEDQMKQIQEEMKPLLLRKKELNKMKQQYLADIGEELSQTVIYKNHQFGVITQTKVAYNKKNIIDHLNDSQHEEFVSNYTTVQRKPLFHRLKADNKRISLN